MSKKNKTDNLVHSNDSENSNDSSDIEKQFNISKTNLVDTESYFNEHVMEIIRMIFLFSIIGIGGYLFYTYFEIEIINLESYWKDYIQRCCNNLTKCDFTATCKTQLYKWIRFSQLNESLINKCCYWFAPYNETVKPFCDAPCFLKL